MLRDHLGSRLREARRAAGLRFSASDNREKPPSPALPSWLTVEGLLTPVEMGLKMWEWNNINVPLGDG